MTPPPATAIMFVTVLIFCCTALSVAQNDSFYTASPDFQIILGSHPKVTLLAESEQPLFHEGGVYYPPTRSLFVTSDVVPDPSTANGTMQIISHVTGNLTNAATVQVTQLNATSHAIPFPLGGYRYLAASNVLVWAGQGSPTQPWGLWFLNPEPPFNATQVLSSYGVYEYNSPNDVAVTPSGEIYFTDPIYGAEYGFRPAPQLPNQVYRYNPASGTVRAVADGYIRPNGIGINQDGSIVYIIDTGAQPGDGTIDATGPRTIYALDVQGRTKNGTGGFLCNRRLFSLPSFGGAKGVKTDTLGNVYVGLDDGVSVFDDDGNLLGKILIDDVANIGFGEPGVLFTMGQTKLWRIDLSRAIVGSSFSI
ncbi:protein AkeP [Cladophialophora carrionii]|uniref:Protein AkeP n=1 Tax=Cladophialophora carrionii TaxID=86049 RepID=A0A1C1CIU9_9EURO|nr:protein AkeP [Cladophialophora carrionii]